MGNAKVTSEFRVSFDFLFFLAVLLIIQVEGKSS